MVRPATSSSLNFKVALFAAAALVLVAVWTPHEANPSVPQVKRPEELTTETVVITSTLHSQDRAGTYFDLTRTVTLKAR